MSWDNPNFDKELLKEVKKEAMKRLVIAGEIVATNCKQECPVDTGKLRDSIFSKKQGDDTVIIGSNVEYAAYVELGTYKMQPRPFLRNGLLKSEGDINDIFSVPIE